MLAKNKKVKVLLYGNIPSKIYRSQILVKSLIESKYYISLVCPDLYTTHGSKQANIVEKISSGIYLIEFFVKAAFTDVIFLLPANTRFIKSAVWAAKLFRKKLIVEPYISLYDTLVNDRKIIKHESKKSKELINKDVLALKKSDFVIHTASYELAYWEKILNIHVERSKVFIAPLCNTSTLFHRKIFMQDGVLKICWWGTFIPLHGLDNILKAMKILQEKSVKFTCTLFGVNNDYFSLYKEKIDLDNLSQNVFLRKDLSFSDSSLPHYLIDNCDLALGIFGNTDKAYNAVPNKLIEALSMGIPTLTMDSPALGEFFDLKADFWTCAPSPEPIAESILAIVNSTVYPVNWQQTRQKVISTFSISQYQKVLSNVLEKVADDLSRGENLTAESQVLTTSDCTSLN